MPSPVIRFRLDESLVEKLGPEPHLRAKAIVTKALTGTTPIGDAAALAADSERASADASVGVASPPPKEAAPADENSLKRIARLKREWRQIATEFPAQAREIGSFEEYERSQP